jgi:DNA-binding winged helix-turn-helix (wHTH) protein
MEGLGSADILEFGRFRFDRRGRSLFRLDQAGKAALVPLGRTALDVLEMLVGAQGELVEREKIMQTVWRGKTVEDANLAVQISHLRDSLGRRSIQTVSGRGYRFVAPMKQPAANGHSVEPVSLQIVTRSRLSIVVLAFSDLSENRDQQYFADGITDDHVGDIAAGRWNPTVAIADCAPSAITGRHRRHGWAGAVSDRLQCSFSSSISFQQMLQLRRTQRELGEAGLSVDPTGIF